MPQALQVYELPAGKHAAGTRLSRVAELSLVVGLTCALLIPCFWQRYIEAGDLSSHVYNAWLATQIENGSAPGLYFAHPWTNVLCDWILEWLLRMFGPLWAERLVTGAAVLVFFWGAFYLMTVVTRRRPWLLVPSLAVLTYGLVFNIGFLNFYVSTGLCLWIIGLFWKPTWKRVLYSLPLWILAFLAHPMPAAWAGFVIIYFTALRRFPAGMRFVVFSATLATIIAAQLVVMRTFPYRWSIDQVISLPGALGLSGVDQVFLSGAKYLVVAAGFGLIWCVLFLERLDLGGMSGDPLVHVWILQLVAYILTPLAIQLPEYQHVFAYIPQRLSLFNVLILCAIVGSARYGRGITRFSALVAGMYFAFLFADSRAANGIEQIVTELAEKVPPGQKFIANITDSNSRLNPLLHVADRACIGRCFSYGNYESATGQFRIRASGPNPLVASTMDESISIGEGRYVVTKAEAPIYAVCNCAGSLCLRRLEAGDRVCTVSLPVSPTFGLAGRDSGMVSIARRPWMWRSNLARKGRRIVWVSGL